ncbi:hypothetical protein [Hymenobacter cellulosilyticus]|uniref:Uncharacterized protein n=1 Tax=Hymenobacter cellulosilyticus TaxID=2932248 RepID=A0A8T9QIS3_9BACT|nr:hypothetical protein [Hymenobacter cellulosilyticus]UOQ74683.1 hypothetical protein MUN79_12895 [Hymenobacter cellulosilyticus]
MTPEEVTEFANKLAAETPASEAYFGIFQQGDGPDESFIRANKQGLRLFAAGLLRAADQVDETLAHETKTLIPLEFQENDWLDGDTSIDYVEPVTYSAASQPPAEPNSLADNLQAYSWLAVGLFLLVSLLVGIGIGIKTGIETIFNWFFG